MGVEDRKVCVTSSAWESHKEATLLFSTSFVGSVPPPSPSLPQAKQSACCVEIGPPCQDGQPCRQGFGWGWLGAVEEEGVRHKWLLVRCSSADRGGQPGASLLVLGMQLVWWHWRA